MATMKEYLAERKKSRQPAQAVAAPAKAAEKTKPVKRPAEPTDQVTFLCGCRSTVGFLAQTRCRGCVYEHRRKLRAEGQLRRHAANCTERLPDQSEFSVRYDAATQTWSGTLVCDGKTFTASESGVFRLLKTLDGLYRESLCVEANVA